MRHSVKHTRHNVKRDIGFSKLRNFKLLFELLNIEERYSHLNFHLNLG